MLRLKKSLKSSSRCRKASTNGKLPRRITRWITTLNQISTWVNHELCLGTQMNRMRRSGDGRNGYGDSWLFKIPGLPFTPTSSGGRVRFAIASTRGTRLTCNSIAPDTGREPIDASGS